MKHKKNNLKTSFTISGKELFLKSSGKMDRNSEEVKRGCGIWINKKKDKKINRQKNKKVCRLWY